MLTPDSQLTEATAHVLRAVSRERLRQERICEEKQREGLAWHSCASPLLLDDDRLPILGEEFGEVCRELCEARAERREPSAVKLRDELVQLAAVAVAWIEAVDERMLDAAAEAA